MEIIWRSRAIRGQEEGVIEDYVLNEINMKSLASKYKTSIDTISAILEKNKIKKRTRSETMNTSYNKSKVKPKILKTKEEQKECIELYYSGWTLPDLGKKFNATPTGLRRRLIQLGVTLRTHLESAGMESVQEKRKLTNLENFGEENPMQNPSTFEKSLSKRYKYKTHTVNGRTFNNLQGYEPQALDYLINEQNIPENNLQSTNIPKIPFVFNGKAKKYFPDLYDTNTNTIYEVKCKYTFNDLKALNLAKREASIKNGYNFEFIVFSNDGKQLLNWKEL